MDQMSLFDLAIMAEHEYRRERLARAYQKGTPAVVLSLGRAVRRAVQRLGTVLDAVSARTDPGTWDEQVTRRAAEISDGLAAMRPQDGAGRRAA